MCLMDKANIGLATRLRIEGWSRGREALGADDQHFRSPKRGATYSTKTPERLAMSDKSIYDHFVEFTNERYPLCTLSEKLEVYLLHFGAKAVPFLQELIEKANLGGLRLDGREDILE